MGSSSSAVTGPPSAASLLSLLLLLLLLLAVASLFQAQPAYRQEVVVRLKPMSLMRNQKAATTPSPCDMEQARLVQTQLLCVFNLTSEARVRSVQYFCYASGAC